MEGNLGIYFKTVIGFILVILLLGIYLKDIPVHSENHECYPLQNSL